MTNLKNRSFAEIDISLLPHDWLMGDGLFCKLIKYYITWCIKVSRNLRDFINLCLWSLILFQVTFSSDLFFWRLAEINMNVEMKFVWRRDWWHIVFERFCNPLSINYRRAKLWTAKQLSKKGETRIFP